MVIDDKTVKEVLIKGSVEHDGVIYDFDYIYQGAICCPAIIERETKAIVWQAFH